MAGNSIGLLFRLTTFGESHGPAIGGIIDGCPAGLKLDVDRVLLWMSRRRPGQSELTTQRQEPDQPEWLSGVFEGVTLGTPIGFIIRNQDARSADYEALKSVYRPSHADFTYEAKYGIRDFRGGGRSSARETACRVVAGAVAEQILLQSGIQLTSWVSAVGTIPMPANVVPDEASIFANAVRCPHPETAQAMAELITKARDLGDSLGGVITCRITGLPAGLGEPVFDKLHADLAKAMMSINAVKGFELGSGFAGASMTGSAHNDAFEWKDGIVSTQTNNSGGIQGGISNGEPVEFRVAFKPVATLAQKQQTIDREGKAVTLEAKGRHDPCVVPRAVPVVQAMAALVMADHLLRIRTSRM